MSRPISLQVHVSNDLAVRVRAAAHRREISVSEWIRSLLSQACEDDDYFSRLEYSVERIARHSVFVMVAVDALLAGHPDHALRERAHQAYARKLRELGVPGTVYLIADIGARPHLEAMARFASIVIPRVPHRVGQRGIRS